MLVSVLRRGAALLLLAALGALALAVPAQAAPDITAAIDSARVLHGEAVPVRIRAANPAGQPYGYNLSFRVVLPAGVAYGSGGPSAPRTIADQPGSGETTLIFDNVSDLSPNSSYELALQFAYDPRVHDVGDTLEVRAQAFVNEDARYVPRFGADGRPSAADPRSWTGASAEQTGRFRIVALRIEKDEPSWEGEIMRGVHDHQTVYTLRVDNNLIRATRDITVVDHLPAGLEFLGCAATPDSTTDTSTNPGSAEEYPGAGPIVVGAVDDCVMPLSVATVVEDPDGAGPLPSAVYTRVEWRIGDLAARGTRILRYRAAIPIRENTATWNGAEPTPGSLGQAVNLDNNNGPETRDEQRLTNYATARGDYAAADDADDEAWLTRTAEDWTVHKRADTGELVQGDTTWWTLTFETSEYRSVRNATVTDTLPDGLCPLDVNRGNLDGGDPECDADDARYFPQDADGRHVPYATAIRNPDGSWTLTWTPVEFAQLAQTRVSDVFTLRFPSRTRTRYQGTGENGPILTRDRVTNAVETDAEAVVREAGGREIYHDGDYGTGTELTDVSEASQVAGDPRIAKRVAHNRTAACSDLPAADYRDGIAAYRPGDAVCWLLRVDFPSGVDTSTQAVVDFLPPGASYIAGSDAATANNTVAATVQDADAADGVLSWTITSGTVPRGTEVFERVVRTRLTPTGASSDFDVLGNLMKFSSVNTAGVSAPLRDQVDIRLITPVVDLVKGVQEIRRAGATVAGPNGPNVDDLDVQAGDQVTYRVDVTNSGEVDAVRVGVWDVLPLEYQCELGSITGISAGGTCVDNPTPGGADRIEWTIPGPIAADGGRVTLTYTARVPLDIGPRRTIPNTAGVTEYFNETNVPGEYFRYEPIRNIDPSREATANAPAADDPSNVATAVARIAKARTTSVDETGNTAGQATIGEFVDYRITATIPAGTSLARGGRLTDTLDDTARQIYDPSSASATLDGAPLPVDGVTLDPGSPTTPPSVAFPDGFAAPAGGRDRVVVLTFRVRVADVAANVRGATLRNDAALTWRDADDRTRTDTARVSTTIVEPVLTQAKGNDRGSDPVSPGDVVTYTLTTGNDRAAAGGNVARAHDVVIVDQLPDDVTPIDADGDPLADGAAVPVPGSEGAPAAAAATWDSTARTISKTVTSLAPGETHRFSYRVRVDLDPVGGSELVNRVTSTTASLERTDPNRRTTGRGYEARAQTTLSIQGATIAKGVDPATATIGELVTYDLDVTIPAGVLLYDVTVVDTLPDSLRFAGFAGAACRSGCPPEAAPAVREYDPRVDGDGTTTIAWDFGDVATALGSPVVMRLTYRAWVRDVQAGGARAPVGAGDRAVNTATVSSNRADDENPPFDRGRIPGTFRDTSPPTRATVTAIEPRVAIEKAVRVGSGAYGERGTAQPGDVLTYRLRIRNTGDAPAHDLAVVDTYDAELTDVVLDRPSAGSASHASPRIAWTIPGPLAPGGEATLTYTARLIGSDRLSAGDEVENLVELAEYWGVPRTVREDPANGSVDYRRYVGTTDRTVVDVDVPRIALVKTTGLPGEPETGDVLVGQPFPWRIVVSNTATTAAAHDVAIADRLPPNWAYVPGSAALDGAPLGDPSIARAASGDTLTWRLADPLAAGGERTLTFRASPSAAAVADPGTGAERQVNTASAVARDGSGATGTRDGPYATGPDPATATLIVPTLGIDKTPDGGTAVAGTGSEFRIAVENTGATAARRLAIRDVLPAGVTYAPGTATADPAAGFAETAPVPGPGAGETTVVWTVATLAPGARVEITVPVRVAADVPDGTTLVNGAEVTSDELTIPIGDRGDLRVAAEVDVAIVKDGPARYVAGDELTWTLRVANDGPSDARDVVVEDVLPAQTTFVSAAAPCAFAAGAVRCALGTLRAGAERTLTITVRTDPDRVGPLENQATVSTTTPDTDPGNDEDAHVSTPDPLADVAIVKTATPAQIHSGGQSTFALTVVNHGPSVARDVEVVDPLPAGLAFVAVDHPGCGAADGTVRCLLGDLPVGVPQTIAIVVASVQDGTWENVATVTTSTPEPPLGGEPNRDGATVTSAPVADLGIVKQGPATAVAGQDVAWTLVATNDGPNPATGVTVVDDLPPGVAFVAAAPSQGACAPAGAQVRCTLGGLAPGASAQIQLVGRLDGALAATTIVNRATVAGAEPDPNPGNDRAETPTRVDPPPPVDVPPTGFDLSIAKRVQGRAPVVGRPFAYRLDVRNAGPEQAHGVVVTDVLPAAVRALSARVADGGACRIRRALVRCEVGTLAAGARAQVAIRVRPVRAGRAVRNSATVAAAAADRDPGNDRASVTTRIRRAPRALLRLRKTTLERGPIEPGATARYRIRVTNVSRNRAVGVRVCDRLPDGVSLVAARGARLRRGDVCWTIGVLGARRSRTFALTVRVHTDVRTRTIRNRAVATADNAAGRRARALVAVAPPAGGTLPQTGRGGGVTG